MASKISAYVDSSAFIAVLDRSDSYHALFAQLFSDPPSLTTTAAVIAETHGWFLRRFDTYRALQFLNFVEEIPLLSVQSVGSSEIKDARRILEKFSDQPLTLVDSIGMAVMKKNKIRRCWSTDRHLSLTGVPLVITLLSD